MKPAPNFSLSDQYGQIHQLSDYQGKWLLIYFYPKDDTPACTVEACSFRDQYSGFRDQGLTVVGISKDTIRSHLRFTDKHQLNFTLLSDPLAETIKAYQAWGEKKMFGQTFQGILRKSYLINPLGQIIKQYDGVDPLHHSQQVLEDFQLFRKAV